MMIIRDVDAAAVDDGDDGDDDADLKKYGLC